MSEAVLVGPFDEERSGDSLADERHLVLRARQGDVEAFDLIMVRYEHRLQRFLMGLVGNVDVAQDLCQETFLAAYRALPRFQGETKLAAWLHTIALNQARSYHRRMSSRFHVPLEDRRLPSRDPDMQDAVATRDLVQKILGRLPRQYSEPLLLQVSGGLNCREIAEILGISEGAVKVRLFRARAAFRQAFDAEGPS